MIDIVCVRVFKEALRKEVGHFTPSRELPRAVREASNRQQIIVISAVSAVDACLLRAYCIAFAMRWIYSELKSREKRSL
jgi:hypothetical protein